MRFHYDIVHMMLIFGVVWLLLFAPQVSQLLIAVEGGQVNKWQGKKLSDIDTQGEYCK